MIFQWPILLFSLGIVPIAIALYILAQRRRRAYTARFTNLALLNSVVGSGPGIRRHIPAVLFLLALTALLLGTARPTAVISIPREQSAVILVIDTSGSMAASDLRPNRMAAAKQAARAFIDSLPQHIQIGLVSFNGAASVRTPLTRDHNAALSALDSLNAEGNTAIGDGLNLALDQLNPLLKQSKVSDGPAPATIVLLSDGANVVGISPTTAAARAKAAHVRVNTIGIGERSSNSAMDYQGVNLDETTLKGIASATGGQYFYAAQANTLKQVYSDLGSQISWSREQTEITALVNALAALFLLTGGFLSLRWFQRFP